MRKVYNDNVGKDVRAAYFMLLNIFFVTLLFASCTHKELCYNHNHFTKVRVAFDWNDYDTEHRPSGMRVVFYPITGGESWIFDFARSDGGIVEIPQNSYNVICYNNDTDGIIFRSENNYSKFSATTKNISTPDGNNAFKTTDFLCGCNKEGVNLENLPEGVETVVTLYPKRMVCRYTYTVRGIKNLSNIVDLRACLSGMSGSVVMAEDILPAGDSNTLLFGGSVKDNLIKGSFYTFGYNSNPNIFTLYIKAKDGKVYPLECNVTEQILKVERKGHIADVDLLIEFDFIVPGGESGGGAGFDVDVSDWNDVNEEIYV